MSGLGAFPVRAGPPMTTILTCHVGTGKTVESIGLNSHHWVQRMGRRGVPVPANNFPRRDSGGFHPDDAQPDAAQAGQRVQTYGVVVVTARRPERSRIGRDMSLQSEWM